ncbi:DUF1365 domain-containing protein [Ensifer soli]|uniref:DUF1365 domain-containing protein n=1 Tax=Ciceribacter sp. sgz301302 TaxID=3342379 RepID=UPI0035BB2269
MTKTAPGADMARNGAPPGAAAVLFDGIVMHQRMKPVGHRFRYTVFSLMVDIDRLDEADRASRLFSVNRNNLIAFFETDHTQGRAPTLRAHADALLAEAGIVDPAARILLVCYPRIAGWVFNPLAVYHAYDAQGLLLAMIYEVRNTFGERHTYVCPVVRGELRPSGLRQTCAKIFHVSPFIDMEMTYHFRMLPPGREIRWRILETDREGPLLAAAFSAVARPLSTGTILRLVARIPHLTLKIVAGIHWEALKIWVKGVAYRPRPEQGPPTSVWRGGRRGEIPCGNESLRGDLNIGEAAE